MSLITPFLPIRLLFVDKTKTQGEQTRRVHVKETSGVLVVPGENNVENENWTISVPTLHIKVSSCTLVFIYL